MAFVSLDVADMALFSDPVGTRVPIPYLSGFTAQVQPAVAFRHFEGNRLPTAFRGSTSSRMLSLTLMYPAEEHAAAVDMAELLRVAHEEAADGRLQLRTNVGRVAGLDPLEVVVPTGWSDVPQVGLVRVFTIEATRVDYTLGV